MISPLNAKLDRKWIEASQRIETLEQQVAALRDDRDSQQRVCIATQAREAKLRGHMLNIASACRIWGGEAERARKMLEECLALPTDDSALMERLKEERENCADAMWQAYLDGEESYSKLHDVIKSMT